MVQVHNIRMSIVTYAVINRDWIPPKPVQGYYVNPDYYASAQESVFSTSLPKIKYYRNVKLFYYPFYLSEAM